MSLRTAPLLALWWLLAAVVSGCSSLPFLNGKDEAAAAAGEPEVPLYDFDVEAPAPLRRLLLEYLDLSRSAPRRAATASPAPSSTRLAAARPEQALSLLETGANLTPT